MSSGGNRVLLIDDEEMLVELGTAMLADMGYEVTGCSSALAALDTYESDPSAYDFVITDQTMPDLSGLELAERFRAINADARIIVSSGYAQVALDPSKHKGMRVLKKPFSYDQLKAALEALKSS